MIRKLSPDETSYFCEQLALMLGAGMQLGDGLEILCEDLDDKRIMAVCRVLRERLNDGSTLADAMEKSGVFPEYSIKMARIGEMTGQLEKVMNGLSEYYSDRAELRRTVRSAVLHPMMLLVMMTVVIIVLVTLVLPMFGDIFKQFDSTVTAAVQQSVDTAYTVGTVILIVLPVIIIISAAVALLSYIPAFRRGLYSFLAAFPLTRRMSRKFSLSKISGAMSMMVSAGIAPDEMLSYAASLVDDKKLAVTLLKCRERVLSGEYFAEVISTCGIFPAMHARSLKIAYSSGAFEQAWKKLSDRCGDSALETAAGLVSFIEPAIVIILTAVIGAILLSVMIPLMNIMSVMG